MLKVSQRVIGRSLIEARGGQKNNRRRYGAERRHRARVLSPLIVVQVLIVMVIVGSGAAFATNPHAANNTPTPTTTPTSTPVSQDSLQITNYVIVYNDALTQITGVTVTVHNRGSAAHSGTVQVAVDHGGSTITGQGIVTNLAAGGTTQITIALGPISIGTDLSTLRIVVVQTS